MEEVINFRSLARCDDKMKEWANPWHCNREMQDLKEKPWNNEEVRIWKKGSPRSREEHLCEGIEEVQGRQVGRMSRRIVWNSGEMAAARLYDDIFLRVSGGNVLLRCCFP